MASRTLLAIGVVGAILSAACGPAQPGSGPAGPSAPRPFTGTWIGAVDDGRDGRGTATLVLTQSTAGGLVGQYEATFPAAASETGTVSGTAFGARATITITPGVPMTCPGGVVLQGALATTLERTGDRVTGRYVGLACGGARAGQLDLARR